MDISQRGRETAAANATSLDASAQLARHVIPIEDRAIYAQLSILEFSRAAAQGESSHATQIYAHLVRAAEANGFLDADLLGAYGRRNRQSRCREEIAADMVRRIGGHDAVLDICDLYSLNPADYGALQ
nr:hypothetical protein [uncultured Duganella sp.]